ncbi:MAG TPA: glycosyltransferase [Candidatus Bathyarchaeia archaeon]|nr:glycosyltransferase [Candidatus Bathyarchaeia archaeon]
MAARVAVLAPFAAPSVRGNAITVERIARGLRQRGVEVRVWDLSVAPEAAVEHQLPQFEPALVHAFHALRTGPAALRLARRMGVPLLVTVTGTDVNHDLFDEDSAPVVRRVLEGATAVSMFDESIAARMLEALPDLAPRLVLIPQSVSFEPVAGEPAAAHWPPAAAIQRAPGPILLFPAGIRPIKRPTLPIEPLAGLRDAYPGLELLYVGPVLDPAEGETLLRLLADHPWARHLGAVPHSRMPTLLELADVVLNCSLSEGGMPNSVMEALALGRAVVASDIPGNRSLVEDGVTGFLFGSPAELAEKAERLLKDAGLRARLGEAGRERVSARFGADRETDGYLAAYTRLTSSTLR